MTLRAPFPWYGGKSRVADVVWTRFSDVAVYCEPFAGSLAVLLGRPDDWQHGRVEQVNDLDGFLCNAWRAILHDPEATAHHADWPANENDLHARHAWLVERRDALKARLEGDPDYHDAKIAGWWLWGMSQWIGGGFCSGEGPWTRQEVAPGDWQLVHLVSAGQGVKRKLVHLGDAGRGVSRQRIEEGLLAWLCALSERLRRVRVCCGDWARVLTPSALLAASVGGPRGIFLDPPYGVEDRADCYSHDSRDLAAAVREWCLAAPADYRIALCGYEGEGHEALMSAGWAEHAWKAQGGYGGQNRDGNENAHRERIWFSPACLSARQLSLLGGT